jgi:hypothetical protein
MLRHMIGLHTPDGAIINKLTLPFDKISDYKIVLIEETEDRKVSLEISFADLFVLLTQTFVNNKHKQNVMPSVSVTRTEDVYNEEKNTTVTVSQAVLNRCNCCADPKRSRWKTMLDAIGNAIGQAKFGG